MASKTKAELLEEAAARGIDADDSMTKAEIEEALEGAGQSGGRVRAGRRRNVAPHYVRNRKNRQGE